MGFASSSVLNGNIRYVHWSNRLRCLTPADFPPLDHRKGFLFEFNSVKLTNDSKSIQCISLMLYFGLTQVLFDSNVYDIIELQVF